MRDIVARAYYREAVEYLAQRILRCDNMRDIVSAREGEWDLSPRNFPRTEMPSYHASGSKADDSHGGGVRPRCPGLCLAP